MTNTATKIQDETVNISQYEHRVKRDLLECIEAVNGYKERRLEGEVTFPNIDHQGLETLCSQLRQALKYAEELRTILYVKQNIINRK